MEYEMLEKHGNLIDPKALEKNFILTSHSKRSHDFKPFLAGAHKRKDALSLFFLKKEFLLL